MTGHLWDGQAVTVDDARRAALSEGDWTTETLRHTNILRRLLVDEHLPPGSLVDIGCGPGRVTSPMAGLTGRDVVGYDISRRMIDHAVDQRHTAEPMWFAAGRTRFLHVSTPEVDTVCAGGWSMLMFQHADLTQVSTWLAAVGAAMWDGGRFVFQFVEGDHHHGLDHRHRLDDMAASASAAGFEVVHTETDGMFPEWRWVVCQA